MPRPSTDQIQLPNERCYYFASRFERDQLLCWIPKADLSRLAQDEPVKHLDWKSVPSGMELGVDEELLQAMGVRVSLHTLYREVVSALDRLDPDDPPLVSAAEIEGRLARFVKSAAPGVKRHGKNVARVKPGKRPAKAKAAKPEGAPAAPAPPRMTPGQDAVSYFNRLHRGSR